MDLQLAINTASAGAIIQIPDNERCIGNFIIDKSVNIVGGVGSMVLAPPAHGSTTHAMPALEIKPLTGPVTLRKLGISVTDGVKSINDIIRYGGADLASGQTSIDNCPKGLWIDECDVFVRSDVSSQRGISANGLNFKITKSKVREIHWKGFDTQAICSWNGPGPFLIEDCYLEATGENILFGGSPPVIQGLIHSDIIVRRCHLRKPLEWRTVWEGAVKNLFELKNARNVLVEGCLMEGNWTDAQAGRAIVFTPRPADSGRWALIEDVVFQYNIIRDVGSGILILGADEAGPDPTNPVPTETRLRRVTVRHNLWEIDGTRFGSNGFFATVIHKTEDVTIDNNTVIQTGNVIGTDYEPNIRFKFRNNICRHNEYGIMGGGKSPGNTTIDHYFPGAEITGNVLVKEVNAPGNVESIYPAGNHFPESLSAVGFVALDSKDYRLSDSSPYKGAGADIAALQAAQGGSIVTPVPQPEPLPEPEPIPPPTIPSPSPGSTVTDSKGGVWTIGPNKETLRNEIWMSGGRGTEYGYVDQIVYVLGMDNNWWKWINNGWVVHGATAPGTTPAPQPQPEPPPPVPAPPRVLLWPNDKSAQTAMWQNQAKEGYRANQHVPRPSGAPKGNYVEFVKFE